MRILHLSLVQNYQYLAYLGIKTCTYNTEERLLTENFTCISLSEQLYYIMQEKKKNLCNYFSVGKACYKPNKLIWQKLPQYKMSRIVRERTFVYKRQAKIQINLRIRTVWSESSLGAFCIAWLKSVFMRTTKTLIRPHWCSGWFESSLGAHIRRYVFSRCVPNVFKSSGYTC